MELWARRKYLRHQVKIPIGVDLGGGLGERGMVRQTKDVCPRGAFVYTRDRARVGTRMFCRMILPSRRRLTMPGTVWRMAPGGLALKFDHEEPTLLEEFNLRAADRFSSPKPRPALAAPSLLPFPEPLPETPMRELFAASHPMTNKQVLLIEQEEPVSRLMERALARSGYRFFAESSSAHGLVRFTRERDEIGLIVLDLLSPGLDPAHFLRIVELLRPDLPVLLLTGYGYINGHDEAHVILMRPFDEEQFLDAVGDAFKPPNQYDLLTFMSSPP